MSNADKEALIKHLEAALAILRGDTEASAESESGGTGSGPPGGGG